MEIIDAENMLAILTYCGFSDVSTRKFEFGLDQAGRQFESIYFEERE